MTARWVLPVALGAALAACVKGNVSDPFPKEVGYQPLEPVTDATWPAAAGGDPTPQALGTVKTGTLNHPDGSKYFDWAHAKGFVHGTLAQVYAAIHKPAASHIWPSGGDPARWTPEVDANGDPIAIEPEFPITFRIHYLVRKSLGPKDIDIVWDLDTRGGPLQGTDAAPTVVGYRYQKVWGSEYLPIESGSLVATQVSDVPPVTAVEMVAWLNASTQGQTDVQGTVQNLFCDLVYEVNQAADGGCPPGVTPPPPG